MGRRSRRGRLRSVSASLLRDAAPRVSSTLPPPTISRRSASSTSTSGTASRERCFLQREVILRDLQINELTISVSDMKGKFIKPTLKKVSKYENKFAKLQEKAA